MKKRAILPVWGRILRGYKPFLSIEITKECPLHCPGCYAYESGHLNNGSTIRELSDLKGQPLVDGVLDLVDRFRPLHISIIGGEPLVRYRELGVLIPKLNEQDIEVQVVTSAVRRIPPEWADFRNLHLAVSIDGLEAEHNARRSPATYARILENIAGHQVIVHCTVTKQLLSRADYLSEFARFWSQQAPVYKIWFSLYTPQEGEISAERLDAEDRQIAIKRLAALPAIFPKVYMPRVVLYGYEHPPDSPAECIFAQTTACVSADLATLVTPCQLGGRTVCSECGCMASAGLASIGNIKLAGPLKVSDVFAASRKLGERFHNRPVSQLV